MYITKYGCVFLKLGESIYIYVAMDLIPILLGSLPLAHNAQHSLVNYMSGKGCIVYTCLASFPGLSGDPGGGKGLGTTACACAKITPKRGNRILQ